MTQGVFMSVRQEFAFWVLEDFRLGKISRKDAGLKLGISPRSVSRQAKRVRESGLRGLAHGNAKRTPKNRSPDDLRERVVALLRDFYYDFNLTHAREKLMAEHGVKISYGTLYAWARQAGVGRGKKQRRTSKARIHRERMANEGLMLQMDGSHHRWNGADEWCLIAMIDDATSDIPYAEFFPGETTLACMKVLRQVVEKKGIPDIIYTDEAGWAGGGKRENFSQFQRVCEELGIRLMTTRSPQAKGRIERAWRTCQDRLVPEFRLNGIKIMIDANRYLQQVFLPSYWRENLTVQPRSSTTRYRDVPAHMNLDHIFCLKYDRIVANDNTVSYDNRRYRIVDYRFRSLRKKAVSILWHENNEVEVFYGHLKLKIELIEPVKRRWTLRPA